jgi:hypothetical protein
VNLLSAVSGCDSVQHHLLMVAAHRAEPWLINQVEAFDVLGAAVDKVANRNQQILCWVEPTRPARFIRLV